MSNMGKRYSPEFKREAVKLCEEKGVYYVHEELGVSTKSLYEWIEKSQSTGDSSISSSQELIMQIKTQAQEIARLKEERDILKKAAIFFANEEKK